MRKMYLKKPCTVQRTKLKLRQKSPLAEDSVHTWSESSVLYWLSCLATVQSVPRGLVFREPLNQSCQKLAICTK